MGRAKETRGAAAELSLRARDAAVLEASRRVVELFVARGTSELPIKELAAHAGISERTFYRYFPRKEDAIRPSIDEGIRQIVERIARPGTTASLRADVEAAYAVSFRDRGIAEWASFWHVLNETESLRATWLQVLTDSEHAIGAALATRLDDDPASPRARLAGALVVAAARAALEAAFAPGGNRRPDAYFTANLRWLSPLLFEARRAPRRTRPAAAASGRK